jgi:D-glycero-D-manno-heptose 1,7-bisphosphate phosphatase
MAAQARPAVFLDRDGTIIEDRGHLADVAEVVFFPYAFAALRRLQKSFRLFIITNQSGVGKGIISPAAAAAVNTFVQQRLEAEGIRIDALYCCPHTSAEGCQCKKPSPYFIHTAQSRFNLDIRNSYVIGDHPHDVECGRNAGATGLYLLSGHGAKHSDETAPGTIRFADLQAATEWIMARQSDQAAGS